MSPHLFKNRNIFSLKSGLLIIFVAISFFNVQSAHALVTNLVDFNTTTDLTDNFNSDGSVQFTNVSSGGIGDTGAINVPLGTTDNWTTKQGYSVAGDGDVYTFSAYFKIQANGGYGGLGFSNADTNTGDFTGQPLKGIGMSFHGGGGSFVNNRTYTDVSWPPDLVVGNWYKMIFKVTAQGSNTYDLNFQIWNSDAAGVLGTMKTEKVLNGVVNADLGGSSIIHGFFAAAGSRMGKIDDFLIQLEGGAAFVEEGAPVVVTGTIAGVGSTIAAVGGEVVDDQGVSVTERGVCVSTSTAPTISDTCANDGTGEGEFVGSLTGLDEGVLYYVRAYATNAEGTSYGVEKTFTTTNANPTIATLSPLDNATAVALDSGLAITFNEAVVWESEPDSVTVYRALDDSVFFAQSGGGGSGTQVLTIAFPQDFESETEYYVIIDNDAVSDIAGNHFAGITSSSTWSFTTLASVPEPGVEDEERSQNRSRSGSSVSSRVKNLLEMGNTKGAQELINQYPNAFQDQVIISPAVQLVGGTCSLGTINRTLRAGSQGEDVRSLQKFLNCAGFLLASTGAGSVGSETSLFSTRTYNALVKFQEEYSVDILAPLGLTKGTGIFGELSRSKAQSFANN
ncbi:MAG: Ig-like domain-containing protein [Candidatus Paceibacterota bacterium]